MSDSLKQKTAIAIIWNTVDKAGFQVVALIIGIFTARMLSPKDFGLIGALSIFTMLSNLLVESGFTSALIRRKNNNDREYTTIFYFNIGLSIIIYAILFVCAPMIAQFFHMPELCSLSRFLFLAIILNSLGIVQNIILTKELAFKQTSMANLISAIIAGIVTIILVIKGYEYWALAWQQILQVGIRVLILWIVNNWRPTLKADWHIIKEVFSFSIFLLITSIINSIIRNIYNVLIGRFFRVQELGYYSQANKFQQIPSNVISMTMCGVALPVLSKLNDDKERQRAYFSKIIRITACMIFPVMIGMLSLTKEFVSILLTNKWLPAVPYFQLMVIGAIALPLHSINVNYIIALGHSRLSFLLEMIKNALIILSLFFCMNSINMLLVGFSTASILSYLIDLFVVKNKTGYCVIAQLKDIGPYVLISMAMFGVVKVVGLINLKLLPLTALQTLTAGVFYIATLKLLGSQVINDVFNIFRHKEDF